MDLLQFQVSYNSDTKDFDQKSINFGYELFNGNADLKYSNLDSLSKQIFLAINNNISSNYDFLRKRRKLSEFTNTEYELQKLSNFALSKESFPAHVICSAIEAFFNPDGENIDDVANRERKIMEERNQKFNQERKANTLLIKKATMSSTPFGPGSFSFIFDENDFVQYLVVETDIGMLFLDTPNPAFPDFPLWSFWDLQESNKKISYKHSVLIGHKYIDAAIYLYLDSLKIGEKLSKDNLSGFWQDYQVDEIPESERLIWHTQPRKIFELPFEIQYLGKWAQSFIDKFMEDHVGIDSWVSVDLFERFLDDSFSFPRHQVLMNFYILTNPAITSKRLSRKDCENLLKPIYEKITKEVGIIPYNPDDDIAVID